MNKPQMSREMAKMKSDYEMNGDDNLFIESFYPVMDKPVALQYSKLKKDYLEYKKTKKTIIVSK